MSNHEPCDQLLSASRLTGADIQFLQLVQLVSLKVTGREIEDDPRSRAQIDSLHEKFRRAYAAIFAKHLGEERARASLAALHSAPVQRFLAARQIIAPALKQRLAALEQRMGNLEI